MIDEIRLAAEADKISKWVKPRSLSNGTIFVVDEEIFDDKRALEMLQAELDQRHGQHVPLCKFNTDSMSGRFGDARIHTIRSLLL